MFVYDDCNRLCSSVLFFCFGFFSMRTFLLSPSFARSALLSASCVSGIMSSSGTDFGDTFAKITGEKLSSNLEYSYPLDNANTFLKSKHRVSDPIFHAGYS